MKFTKDLPPKDKKEANDRYETPTIFPPQQHEEEVNSSLAQKIEDKKLIQKLYSDIYNINEDLNLAEVNRDNESLVNISHNYDIWLKKISNMPDILNNSHYNLYFFNQMVASRLLKKWLVVPNFNGINNISELFSNNITNVIDLNSLEIDRFSGSLEILNIIEAYKSSNEHKNNSEINEILKSLNYKSKENDSNLILSSFVDSITNLHNSEPTKFLRDKEYTDIGDNRFIDRSIAFSNNRIQISKPEDHDKIISLIVEKNYLENKIEDIINSKNIEKGKEIDLYDEYNIVIDKLDNLIKLDIKDNDLSISSKPDKENLLNKKIFILIWSNDKLRSSIEKKIGFKLNDFSLAEQAQIINFIKTLNNFDSITINNFSKKYGKDGLRTFLSIEQGGRKMGDKIIELGEKLPEAVVKKVFIKYGEIIDNVSKITEFARTNFTKEIETNPELIKKIEETLYIKGKQFLSQTYEDINNKKEINYEDISKQLDRINADTITTFAIFKQAVKNGEKLPIESIEGSVFSKKEAIDMSDSQQNEMLELYESNWKNHPDLNFVESLKSYFKTAFSPEDNKQKNYFYTFEKDNNIRAFVRFEKQNDASFYASALNVDEASKNFGLGEAMMDEALTREAKDHILHASCRKDNPSNMRYFEKGFIAKGFKKTNETEELDLVWDENKNKDILAKQKSLEELIGMYGNTNTEGIEIKKSKDLESLHSIIPDGKSLVRCFVNNGEWYGVYEVVSKDYGINLGETK